MDSRKIVKYAVANVAAQTNEDVTFACVNHPANPNISSFGVYDGHFGTEASSILSSKLNNMVVDRYELSSKINSVLQSESSNNILVKSTDSYFNKTTTEERDEALFCEAIYYAFEILNDEISIQSDSGSTAVVLFIKVNPDDGTSKIYCANVGDSRCIMLGCVDLSVIHENGFENNCPKRDDLDMSSHSEINASVNSLDEDASVDINIVSSFAVDEVATPIPKINSFGNDVGNKKLTIVALMSEDHKLSLGRERLRISTKSVITPTYFPVDPLTVHAPMEGFGLKLFPRKLTPDNLNIPALVLHKPEKGSLQDFRTNFEKNINICKNDYTQQFISDVKAEIAKANRENDNNNDKNNNITPSTDAYKIIHEESFIFRRKAMSSNGVVTGPEALCGRHNVSITMTRSIGDKYGPRSCIGIPEISCTTIPSQAHVRFVLASDGLWDIFAVEAVRRNAMSESNRDPREFASYLVKQAYRRRVRDNIRLDDISVIVVDHCLQNFVPVKHYKGGMSGQNRAFIKNLVGRSNGPPRVLPEVMNDGCQCTII